MKRKKTILLVIVLLIGVTPVVWGDSPPLPRGYGKALWGMKMEEVIRLYNIELRPPSTLDGVRSEAWAVIGPAPEELTVSGRLLGDPEVRSVSFAFHPRHGLAVIHVRFLEELRSVPFDEFRTKLIHRFGEPKEINEDVELRGHGDVVFRSPQIIWEDTETHLELNFHRILGGRDAHLDHYALVIWSKPIKAQVEAEQSPSK